jgi:short-subunit dehydrogenase
MTQPQHLTILTGASRGMGLAMAQQLLKSGNTLICIARSANPDLALGSQGRWRHAGAMAARPGKASRRRTSCRRG